MGEMDVLTSESQGGIDVTKSPQTNRRAVAIWLLICAALVYVMVVLGGVTRLTQSGLSMVDWDPVMGTVPPITNDQWQETFGTYQEFPEYQLVNQGMTLGEFKSIFYYEYAHRMLGRLIGLALIVPALYFLVRRRIDRKLGLKVLGIFALVGLEGLLGWFMVASGLVDKPHVSPYRLAAHLLLATVIFGAILWVASGLIFPPERRAREQVLRARYPWYALVGLILLMMITGAFVAGTKAGFAFNTFPLMGGRLVPTGILDLAPLWSNFFENMALVQFEHRVLAIVIFVAVPILGVMTLRRETSPRVRGAIYTLMAVVVVQVALGITTLLLAVPVTLGASHQAVALIVFAIALFVTHEVGRPAEQIDRGAPEVGGAAMSAEPVEEYSSA